MIQVFPSILEKSPEKLIGFVNQTQHLFTHYQIDVVDSSFAQESSASIEELLTHLSATPHQARFQSSFEMHLMTQDLQSGVTACQSLAAHINISTILVHLEPLNRWLPDQTPEAYTKLREAFSSFEFGIVIEASTQTRQLFPVLEKFPLVQIMTVEPGAHGRPFRAEALEQIAKLRDLQYGGKIQLDGGINMETMKIVMRQPNLPDAVCPGSFFQNNTEEHYRQLTKLISE